MSDEWPPGWEDPEEEFASEADEARLAEVTAYLVSVPAAVLPDAVAARISAALADEAAARAGGSSSSSSSAAGAAGAAPAADSTVSARTLGRPRSKAGRHRGGRRDGHRAFRKQTLVAAASVAGVLILGGLGYALSHGGSSASSSASLGIAAGSPSSVQQSYAGAAAAPAASAQTSRAVAAPVPAATASSRAAASAPAASAPVASAAASAPAASASASAPVSFVVVASGTEYQKATLAAQVRARLAGPAIPGTSPSAALRSCVSGLTGSRSPSLVDRATYQSSPAYIIASSSQVWVVGLGCTAGNPELITSVPLAG